jgi:hypothetical protein
VTCRATCGCEREAVAHGLCQGHVKQYQRGKLLTPLRGRLTIATLDEADALLKLATISFADASGEGDEARAFEELLRAFEIRAQVCRQPAGLSNPIR